MLKLLFLISQAVLTAGMCGSSSVGRISACQVEGRGFNPRLSLHYRGVAQFVRASGLGPEGRELKSLHPDHFTGRWHSGDCSGP